MKRKTPIQLVTLAKVEYYADKFNEEHLQVYNDVKTKLEEEYPGNGPYSTAVCEFTDLELQYFDNHVRKVTMNDDEDDCILKVLQAVTLASEILNNRIV